MLGSAALAIGSLVVFGYAVYANARYMRQRKWIRNVHESEQDQAEKAGDLPKVSVIIAARNEEASIERTLRGLLRQSYPKLEILVVNDRSTDRTGELAEKIASEAAVSVPSIPITVHHIEELPEGWLGKNHALHYGYTKARGELLLFTDADVQFGPEAIRAAVRVMRTEEAGQVTIAPRMLTGSFWLGVFVHYFLFSLSLYVEPWLSNDDRSNRSFGIGAFNLLTRQAYERIGTHRALAFRPDDDLRLGQLVKAQGIRQRLLAGGSHLEVEWYPSLGEAVRGLEKNFYSGFHYKLLPAIIAILGQLAAFIFPLFGFILAFPHWYAWLYLGAYLLIGVLYMTMVRDLLRKDRLIGEALVLPAASLLTIYVLIRSITLTYIRGGVYWRGTFYSLEDLKKLT